MQDELSCSKVFAVGRLADLFMYVSKGSTSNRTGTFHVSDRPGQGFCEHEHDCIGQAEETRAPGHCGDIVQSGELHGE